MMVIDSLLTIEEKELKELSIQKSETDERN
jgi:hypothetical protein